MTALRSVLLPLAGLALAIPPGPDGAAFDHLFTEARGALTQLVRAAAPLPESSRLAATTLQAPGIATEARRTRQPARSLGAPSFSRVVITPQGTSTFEGDGAPGTRVTISIGGRAIGTQAVGPLGRWRISMERPLPAGDHHIEASARFETGTQVLLGDELRIAIPPSYSGSAIVAFDIARDGPAPRATGREGAQPASPAPVPSSELRRRAEELAERASRGFDAIQRKATPSDDTSSQPEIAARQPSGTESDAVQGSWTDAVLHWLHRANRDYQREIAGKLARAPQAPEPSTPEMSAPAAAPAVTTEQRVSDAERARNAAVKRLFAEEEARKRAERDALLAHSDSPRTEPSPGPIAQSSPAPAAAPVATPQDGPRSQPQEVIASEAELAAERAALEEQAQRIERRRQAAEMARRRAEAKAREIETEQQQAERLRQEQEAQRKLIEERKASEAKRLADEAERLREEQEAQRKLIEERKASEAKRLADEAERLRQQQEAQRKLAEERKASEAKRLADEAERLRQEQEAQRKLAEDRKETETRGLMAEEARRREAALRKQAEERMAVNADKQPREPARTGTGEAPRGTTTAERRPPGESAPPAGSGHAGNIEVLREAESRRASRSGGARRPDPRIAEGSAEQGPVDGAGSSGSRAPTRPDASHHHRPPPASCRGRKAGMRVKLPGIYLVRRGDTLWAIARRHYGSGTRYPIIFRANRRTIADPDLIYPCQAFHLPRRGRRG